MSIKITGYEALCNLGENIDEIYSNAIEGNSSRFISDKNLVKFPIYTGKINAKLNFEIKENDFNLRCNKLILKTLSQMTDKINKVINKYPKERIGIVCTTTNSGVEEYETTRNKAHYKLSNPALFLKNHLSLKNVDITVSTACSSGLKGFLTSRDLLNSNVCDCIIMTSVDPVAKIPLYGFNSLEVMSKELSNPFSKNRKGMNLGEACIIFILEKNQKNGIEILGIGETSDIYHLTTPNPDGKKIVEAILNALNNSNLSPNDIDYINLHGTGTIANDKAEANGIYEIFKNLTPASSTKPVTGHCLGAAAGIETALCCKLIENFDGRLYPHIYDGIYDNTISKINLVQKGQKYKKCEICMCNSFGFGGTNSILILGHKK